MCAQQRLRPACACAQSDQSLCLSFEYSLTVKLLTEQHLLFLSLKGGCTGSSEFTLVKMPHCPGNHMSRLIWNEKLHRSWSAFLKKLADLCHYFITKYQHVKQWHSQNTEKVTRIKGRLLEQAMIHFSCVPFSKMGTSLKRKNLLPKGSEFFPLRAFPYGMENH